ncbi:MAG: FtsX-like permease family protein [Bdellovibrionia bacterium]
MRDLPVLLQIAFRNLFASFLNVIIGMIILVGTMLFVVGGSVLNSIDSSMSKSIKGSIAGDVQVYSDKSKDELALYDNWTLPDLTPVTDFSELKPHLMGIENVQTVIPMGVNGASVMYGNTVDITLERLRAAVNAKAAGDSSQTARIESLKTHVRQIIKVIQEDYKKLKILAVESAIDADGAKALEKAASDGFWASFDSDALGHLEFMENKIALLVPDSDFIFLSYVGTDIDAFQKTFDRMEIVDGQAVPTGKRGMLISKYMYEEQFKMKTARRMDKIHEAVTEKGTKIEGDPDLALMIKQNKTQTREFLLQLDPQSAQLARESVQKFINSKENDLGKLLSEFFDSNDSNFVARYEFFYKELAPLVQLYRLKPGEFLTIKSFTKSGFVQSSNVKIYGTFQFKGLEKSGMAGSISLMDLMTFRDLYGYVTPEKFEESNQLKAATGVKFVGRENAEAELFGGTSVVGTGGGKKIDDAHELGGVKYDATKQALLDRVYTPEEIEKGVILNAAVILKDPGKMDETMAKISEVSKQKGLDLRVVTWQKAAGNIGQFVFVAKLALYFAVFIIFIVALVIINNAVMMATLQRVREIGTMRAIGAQRSFVLSLVVIETMILGLTFGTVGTFLGSVLVKYLGTKGIPAGNEFLYFFFSGPRLYVTLGLGSLIGAFVTISVVTSISALYPAIIATRISPLQAMQTED